MPDKLMSPQRQQQLLKAAESTIGLMNIGVDGHAALQKIAEDEMLNDHEVTVVAHAVNNSRQLAHLESSEGDEREDAFPLIDPRQVRPHGETQPATNADQSTGDRYGKQETPGDTTEQKYHEPEAVDVHQELSKAAAASYHDSGDYRLRADQPDHAQILREGWGLEKVAERPQYTSTVPFSKISHYRIGIDEGQMRYLRNIEACHQSIAKVAEAMRHLDAPEWGEVEKVAHQLGAEPATLDIIYAASGVEKFGQGRADLTKVASTVYTSQRVKELAEECVRADTFWKAAADVHAATAILREQYQEAEADLFPKEAAVTIDASPSHLAQPLASAPTDLLGGLQERTIRDALDQEAKGESGEVWEGPKPELKQELRELRTQHRLQQLMSDDFISGHGLPEVVDAYNAAISVNPNFGHAELVSYVRQHLATQGAVPFDQQIRARESKQVRYTREDVDQESLI